MNNCDYLQAYERFTVCGVTYVHLSDDHHSWWLDEPTYSQMLDDPRAWDEGELYSDWVEDWGEVTGDLKETLDECAARPDDAAELIANWEKENALVQQQDQVVSHQDQISGVFDRSSDMEEDRLNGKVEMVSTKDGWQDAYYRCEHWKRVRQRRMEIDNFRCCRCHNTADLQVHHWYYELFNEHINDLMTLCQCCHEYIHSILNIPFPKTVPLDIFQELDT